MNLRRKLGEAPTMATLRLWNFVFAAILGLQAIVILALSNGRSYPISTSFLTTDSLQTSLASSPVFAPSTKHLFDINMGYLVGLFLLILAAYHFSVATWYRANYEQDLANGVNRLRWIGQWLSGGLMLLAVAILTGMYDLTSLVLVFVLCGVLFALGLVMEFYNTSRVRGLHVKWGSYGVGVAAGVVALLAIGGYLLANIMHGTGGLPASTYLIYLTIFLGIGLSMDLIFFEFKKLGPWKRYLFAERAYMILGLVVSSILAWQIFVAVLNN